MTRVWLVRHGEADAGWGDHQDPGLSPTGLEQAEALARSLAPLGPLPLVTSPMERCRQTAAPLAARWRTPVVVDPAVGEITAPGVDLADRPRWLSTLMAGSWGDAGERERAWRDAVVERISSTPSDTVIVTHFVLVNAVVGAATDDDRVLCVHPAHASVTVVERRGPGILEVVSRAEEARTDVL